MGTILLYKRSGTHELEKNLGYATNSSGEVLKALSTKGIIWEYQGHTNFLSTETNHLLVTRNHHGLVLRPCKRSIFGTSITDAFSLERFLDEYEKDKAVADAFVSGNGRTPEQIRHAFMDYLDMTYRNPMNRHNLHEHYIVCFDNASIRKRKPTLVSEMEPKISVTLEAADALFGIKTQDELRQFFLKFRNPNEPIILN